MEGDIEWKDEETLNIDGKLEIKDLDEDVATEINDLKNNLDSTIESKIEEKTKDFITGEDVDSKISSATTGLAKTSDLNNYVTSSSLSSTLNGYVQTSNLNSSIGSYLTTNKYATEKFVTDKNYLTSSSTAITNLQNDNTTNKSNIQTLQSDVEELKSSGGVDTSKFLKGTIYKDIANFIGQGVRNREVVFLSSLSSNFPIGTTILFKLETDIDLDLQFSSETTSGTNVLMFTIGPVGTAETDSISITEDVLIKSIYVSANKENLTTAYRATSTEFFKANEKPYIKVGWNFSTEQARIGQYSYHYIIIETIALKTIANKSTLDYLFSEYIDGYTVTDYARAYTYNEYVD